MHVLGWRVSKPGANSIYTKIIYTLQLNAFKWMHSIIPFFLKNMLPHFPPYDFYFENKIVWCIFIELLSCWRSRNRKGGFFLSARLYKSTTINPHLTFQALKEIQLSAGGNMDTGGKMKEHVFIMSLFVYSWSLHSQFCMSFYRTLHLFQSINPWNFFHR